MCSLQSFSNALSLQGVSHAVFVILFLESFIPCAELPNSHQLTYPAVQKEGKRAEGRRQKKGVRVEPGRAVRRVGNCNQPFPEEKEAGGTLTQFLVVFSLVCAASCGMARSGLSIFSARMSECAADDELLMSVMHQVMPHSRGSAAL